MNFAILARFTCGCGNTFFYASPGLQEDTIERTRYTLAAAVHNPVVEDKDFTTFPFCGTEYKLLPA